MQKNISTPTLNMRPVTCSQLQRWHLKRAKYPCPRRHVPLLSTHFMKKISVLLECPSHPARERTCPNTPAKIEAI